MSTRGLILRLLILVNGGPFGPAIPGPFADLEDQLTSRFDLKDAVVVDCPAEGDAMVRDLGAALAYFLETTLKPGKVIGISSWSSSARGAFTRLARSGSGDP